VRTTTAARPVHRRHSATEAIVRADIQIPIDRVAEFCRKHGIRKLEVFGSALRDDFGPESDLDIMVEFEPERIPGLAFFVMDEEIAEIFGRKVDLHTRRSVEENPNNLFRKQALSQVATLYDAA
jgi:uncharacterized protein